MEYLMRYSWPGNIRELKSAFEYAFVTCHEHTIQPYHLPPDIIGEKQSNGRTKALKPTKEEMKKKQLVDALSKAKGNQSMAADILGVSRVTVWNQMKRFGIHFVHEIETQPDG
jgi:two-component system response regulator HydG